MENQYVHDRASSVENVTVGGRMREYLTEKEVDRLIEAALTATDERMRNAAERRRR